MGMQVLRTRQSSAWTDVVEQCLHYDFYHLPRYHALAEESGEGEALLFDYREDAYRIALPLLIRSLDGLPGIGAEGTRWRDATSVYGYAGPIASHANIPNAVLRDFQVSLRRHLLDLRVVTVFSRLHPIFPQQELLAGIGECRTLGRTVSIDLTPPSEASRAAFRKKLSVDIIKLRRLGVTCEYDRERRHLDTFFEIYRETMERVGAAPRYYFTPEYFHRLSYALGERFHLFVCSREGRIVCGAIFAECGGILQYHLGGTLNAALKFSPMKVLLDDMRIWAIGRDLKLCHLGGGASTRPQDSLFRFKLRFSGQTHDFALWQWVLRAGVYARLCREWSRWKQENGVVDASTEFFPEYRTPTVRPEIPAQIAASETSAWKQEIAVRATST